MNKLRQIPKLLSLTLITVDSSGVCFSVAGEVGVIKTSLRLKLVRSMLETWNLVGKYTHIYSFRKYSFYYQEPLSFADVRISFAKNQIFLLKLVALLKAIL